MNGCHELIYVIIITRLRLDDDEQEDDDMMVSKKMELEWSMKLNKYKTEEQCVVRSTLRPYENYVNDLKKKRQ